MTQAELAARLESNPLLLAAMGAVGLLAAIAFLSLSAWVAVRARQGRLAWNVVPALHVKGTEVLAFFLILILLLLNDMTRLLAWPVSLLGVIWLIRKSGASLTLQWGLDRLRPARAGALGIWASR